jgi:hypothetical protein
MGEVEHHRVLTRSERISALPAEPFKVQEGVGEHRLALQDIKPLDVEPATFGDQHALGISLGTGDVRGDGEVAGDIGRQSGEQLQDGGSVVFVLLRKVTGDKVLDQLGSFRGNGKVLQTSLSAESEQARREVLENDANT